MKKFTKRLGLLMLVLVLGLCSIAFVGCSDDSNDTENDAMLVGGFTRVSCDTGVAAMSLATQEDEVDELVRILAVFASATEKDFTVNVHNFTSYSASYNTLYEESKNGKKDKSNSGTIDEVFSNKDGVVEYSINFDNGTETEYFYKNDNNYYWAEKSEGEISKKQWDKTLYESEIANYSFLISSVLNISEADELTFNVVDCSKKNSVYRLKLTAKTTNDDDTRQDEIIFDFDTATQKIVKLSSTTIATTTDGDGNSNKITQIIECTEFNYTNISITIPQDILNAQVNNQ